MSIPTKVYTKFKRDPNLPLLVAHGVYGGLNQHGEIEMNFFSESEELPAPIEQLVAEDGTILSEEPLGEGQESRTYLRTIHSRIVISTETAQSLVLWLVENIDRVVGNNNIADEADSVLNEELHRFQAPQSKHKQ